MAGWLGGLEPVRLLVEGRQLILEAGQDDRWLVSDLDGEAAKALTSALETCQTSVRGLQFIAIQASQTNRPSQAFG